MKLEVFAGITERDNTTEKMVQQFNVLMVVNGGIGTENFTEKMVQQ